MIHLFHGLFFLRRGALATTRPTAVLRVCAPLAAATGPCGPWLRHLDGALGSWEDFKDQNKAIGVLKWGKNPNSSNFFMGFSIKPTIFRGTPIDGKLQWMILPGIEIQWNPHPGSGMSVAYRCPTYVPSHWMRLNVVISTYFNWENDDKQFFWPTFQSHCPLDFVYNFLLENSFRSTPCGLPGQGLERSWGLRDFILPHNFFCTKMLDTLNIPMLKRMRRYWILAPLSCCIAQGGRLAGHAENAAMHLRSPRAEQKTELGAFGSIWQFQYSFHQMISEVDLLKRDGVRYDICQVNRWDYPWTSDEWPQGSGIIFTASWPWVSNMAQCFSIKLCFAAHDFSFAKRHQKDTKNAMILINWSPWYCTDWRPLAAMASIRRSRLHFLVPLLLGPLCVWCCDSLIQVHHIIYRHLFKLSIPPDVGYSLSFTSTTSTFGIAKSKSYQIGYINIASYRNFWFKLPIFLIAKYLERFWTPLFFVSQGGSSFLMVESSLIIGGDRSHITCHIPLYPHSTITSSLYPHYINMIKMVDSLVYQHLMGIYYPNHILFQIYSINIQIQSNLHILNDTIRMGIYI